jgi:2-keto-4-pentenoate hydratase
MAFDANRIARLLEAEHRSGTPFRPASGVADLDQAYAVQEALVGLNAAARGAAKAGYKIGLTTPRMQAFCGIDHPVAGTILGDRVVASGARLDPADYGRLGIEFEICVRLARDLPLRARLYAPTEIAEAIEGVCPAIEIIDDRSADYGSLDAVSLVADNAWNEGIVLGEFRDDFLDLAGVTGMATMNGAIVGTGTGADVLGHPLAALAWLAQHLGTRGRSLEAGDLVMTGSIVTTHFPQYGELYRFEIPELGAVDVAIGRPA